MKKDLNELAADLRKRSSNATAIAKVYRCEERPEEVARCKGKSQAYEHAAQMVEALEQQIPTQPQQLLKELQDLADRWNLHGTQTGTGCCERELREVLAKYGATK